MERATNICVKNDNLILVDEKLYKAFPFTACDECAFDVISDCCREARCVSVARKDKKCVIFKQVQKVSLFEYTFNKGALTKVKRITSKYIQVDKVTNWVKEHNELLEENKRWEFVKNWK